MGGCMSAGSVELAIAAGNELGEGPSWDPSARALLWVDILRKEIHRYSVDDSRHEVRELGVTVTAIVPRDAVGYALTLENSIAVTAAWDKPLRPLAQVDHGPHPCRMNDAKCDSRGRLWAGSMALDSKPGAGALYRFDPDGSAHRMLSDVTISNGLGWSPDDRWMYYVDTGRKSIDVFSFDATDGSISHRRTLVSIPTEQGLPDGLAVDSEGSIWLALWGGGAVHRYSPNGDLVEIVDIPATQVSSCAFGGRDLRDLFVTTAATGLSRSGSTLAEGGLFRVRVRTPGLPTNPFRG
jgi:sugar lactone lactonase YvrE